MVLKYASERPKIRLRNEDYMAKIKQAFRKMTESFSEFVLHRDSAVEKHQLNYEHNIELAKIKSYEVRRHTF